MKYTTLDQVVRAANAEMGYRTLHRYILFLHFAFDAFFKVQRDGVIKNLRYISRNMIGNRVELPDDIIHLGKVGVTSGRRIITAIPDEQLSIDPANTGDSLVNLVAEVNSNVYSFFELTNIHVSDAMARGAVADGSYHAPRFKKSGKELIFDRGEDGAKVYIEIVESGIAPGVNTLINQDSVLPIKSYIAYRFARFKFGAAARETKEAQAEYDDELEEAVASQSNLTGNTILNAISLRYWNL